jgi:hypothetical protein
MAEAIGPSSIVTVRYFGASKPKTDLTIPQENQIMRAKTVAKMIHLSFGLDLKKLWRALLREFKAVAGLKYGFTVKY